MAFTIVEYIRADGANPYRAWFSRLDPQAAAKVQTAILRLEMGNTSRVKWLGAIGEYRIDWGPGYRFYLMRDGDVVIVLLGGGTKKRQQTDIERAVELAAEYRARRAALRRGRSTEG